MTKNSDVAPKKKISTDEDVEIATEASVQNDDNGLDKQNEDIDLNEAIKKKDAELNELVDRMQRLAAEYDNFRKRTQKEKKEFILMHSLM